MSNEDTKKTLNNAAGLVVAAILAILIMILVIRVAIMPLEINALRAQEGRLMAGQAAVTLTVEEKASFVDATASYAKDSSDSKPIDRWIDQLAAGKRWGLLPPLPKGYQNDWVENVQDKPVLLPKSE